MPSITTRDGTTLQVTKLRSLPEGGRVAIKHPQGQKWYLEVYPDGTYELEASWNADGEMADVPTPDGLEEELVEYAGA